MAAHSGSLLRRNAAGHLEILRPLDLLFVVLVGFLPVFRLPFFAFQELCVRIVWA
jgi:hypothetical protein